MLLKVPAEALSDTALPQCNLPDDEKQYRPDLLNQAGTDRSLFLSRLMTEPNRVRVLKVSELPPTSMDFLLTLIYRQSGNRMCSYLIQGNEGL